MKVLIACEFSQIVTKAFRKRGHKAYSCDLLSTEGNPDWHFQCDVRDILNKYWDLIIAHVPCFRLCNSGVRWLAERNLWYEMKAACEFFNLFQLQAKKGIKICIENPIPHKYAIAEIGKYNQIIQPWQFGHEESKAICLWLYNLPPLVPTKIMDKREQRVWKESPGPERWKNRSRFYTGIAKAMAEQWG